MNASPDDDRTHARELHEQADRLRDEPRDGERKRDAGLDRTSRIGAEQLAAPSTRRWRRAGRSTRRTESS
jgi:hypothetical protein